MEPTIYESVEHEFSFKRKVTEWNCWSDPERYAALYLLLADPNIREHRELLFVDDLKIIADAGPNGAVAGQNGSLLWSSFFY